MNALFLAIMLGITADTTLPVYNLEEVVVTATRVNSSIRNLPTNVTVITKDMIAQSNAVTVADAVDFAAGITDVGVQGTRGAISTVRIRSGGDASKQVLVMIDGQPVNDVSLGGANLDELPVDYVERIEIVRGPNSVLYGADALGGVINIITKTAAANNLQVSDGSFGTQTYSANIGMKQGSQEAIFMGSRKHSDGWRKNSDYGGNDFFGKLAKDFGTKGNLDVRFIYHNSEFGAPGENTTPIAEYNNNKELQASSPDARQTSQNEYAQIEYENKLGDNTAIQSKAYSNITRGAYSYPSGFTDALTQTHIYGVGMQINTFYGFSLGVEAHHDECLIQDLTVFPYKTNIYEKTLNQAIFLQNILSIGSMTAISGVRYDEHSVSGGEFSPRLSFVYHPLEAVKLSANIGRAFRAPTFEDLYSPYSSWQASQWGPAGNTQGNPDLKPEESWGYDMGIEYKPMNNLSFQVTAFYSNVKNLIQWANVSPDPNYEKWRPSNIGQAYNDGIEFLISHNISKNLHHSLEFNTLDSKGKNEGDTAKTLMYTPPFRGSYSIGYTGISGFGIDISADFTARIAWEDDYATKHQLPAYNVENIRISQRISNINIFGAVNNAFDRRYQSREDYPLPGRNFNLGMNWNL